MQRSPAEQDIDINNSESPNAESNSKQDGIDRTIESEIEAKNRCSIESGDSNLRASQGATPNLEKWLDDVDYDSNEISEIAHSKFQKIESKLRSNNNHDLDDADIEDKYLTDSFSQVPFTQIQQRIDTGSNCLLELGQQIQIQMEYLQKCLHYTSIAARNRVYELEIRNTSSEKALESFKQYNFHQSNGFAKQFKELNESVNKKIEDLKVERASMYNKYKVAINNVNAEVHQAVDSLEKAKRTYTKAKLEMLEAKEKLTVLEAAVSEYEVKDGKFLKHVFSAFEGNPENDRDKQQKKVHRRYNSLLACTAEIVSKKRLLRESLSVKDLIYSQVTQGLENLEKDRINATKTFLQQFCMLERTNLESRLALLAQLEAATEVVDSKRDIQVFIKHEKCTELTHKYAKALDLLDWDYTRRQGTANVGHISATATDPSANYHPSKKSNNKLFNLRSWGEKRAQSTSSLHSHGNHNTTNPHTTPLVHSQSGSVATPETPDANIAQDEVSITQKFESVSLESTPNRSRVGSGDSILDSQMRTSHETLPLQTPQTPQTSKIGNVDDGSNSQMQDVVESDKHLQSQDAGLVSPEQITQFEKNRNDSLDDSNPLFCDALTQNIPQPYQLNCSVSDAKDAIDRLFDSEFQESRTGEHESHELYWEPILNDPAARNYLMRCLDEKRGRHSLLSEGVYVEMLSVMKVMLDYCQKLNDVKSALRMLNMANTFYMWIPSENSSNPSDSSTNIPSPRRDGTRKYCMRESMILNHPLWRAKGFWEAALFERISDELTLSQPVLWDELTAESLREAVISTHNIIFGQLGTMAFTMYELGLSFEEVRHAVAAMSAAAQLAEEQEHDLVRSVYRAFNKNI